MDAVEYVKALCRMCKSQTSCNACALYSEHGCICTNRCEDAKKVVLIVEQWSKDHPVKTRQSEFLKMFPNVRLYRDVITIPPCSIEKEMRGNCLTRDCFECRRTYWLTEVTP